MASDDVVGIGSVYPLTDWLARVKGTVVNLVNNLTLWRQIMFYFYLKMATVDVVEFDSALTVLTFVPRLT